MAAKRKATKRKTGKPAKRKAGKKAPSKATAKGGGDLGQITDALHAIVRAAAPDAELTKKWGQDVYVLGKMLCAIATHTAHVNLVFFQGAELPDPKGLLEGTGKAVRHMKLRAPGDVDRAAVTALVKAAAERNR